MEFHLITTVDVSNSDKFMFAEYLPKIFKKIPVILWTVYIVP